MIDGMIGSRIKALREARKESQGDIAQLLGFRDRQTVGQIEAGERKVAARELLVLLEHFAVPLERFTNPYLLSGNERFSWRQQGVSAAELEAFQLRAGEWIGAYRELSRQAGKRLPSLMPRLGLTYTSSYEDAEAAGEDVARELDLGNVPSAKLAEVMEDRLGIVVLMVETIPGVSGAACTLPELNAALINRNDPATRRNFDLAHELFHLLTWDTMPPQWIDGEMRGGSTQARKRMDRVEQLANKFAAGLLMPTAAMERLGEPSGDLVTWINAAAGELGVSSSALRWQLVNSRRGPADLANLPEDAFREGRVRGSETTPALFSQRFVARLASAIESGHISARRAAALTDLTLDDLAALCDEHAVARPTSLREDAEARV